MVLGVGYGGFVALSPSVLAEFFGAERLGGLLGVLNTAVGVGSALGPPSVGLVVDVTGSYTPAIFALALLGLAAFAALLPLERSGAGKDLADCAGGLQGNCAAEVGQAKSR